MTCPDLCTAAKCAELENKISLLESQLLALEQELIAHVNFPLTRSHDFDLNITGALDYDFSANSIRLELYLVDPTSELLATSRIVSLPLPFIPEWDFNAHVNQSIPDAHQYIPNVLVDVFEQDDGSSIVKVQVDGNSDEDTFNLEPLELAIVSNQDLNYDFTVSLGNKTATESLELANQQIDDDVIIDLIANYLNNLDFFFRIDDQGNNNYQFTIQFGDKVRSQILDLPRDNVGGGGTIEIPPTTVAINGNYDKNNNNLNLSVTVDGVSAVASINLDEMPFQSILDCLQIIKETLEEEKEIETVTIVAAPEVQANIKDTILVLDFTTVAAFPGLNETKNKWRVQIPAPKQDLTWDDLKDIRWSRGSQYGQVKFVGRINSTSGWFSSEDAGTSYFNQIDNLTNLEIDNIIFPKHSNPKISPQTVHTRVYRAFKVFIGENGEPNQALTEVLKPPKTEEENGQSV